MSPFTPQKNLNRALISLSLLSSLSIWLLCSPAFFRKYFDINPIGKNKGGSVRTRGCKSATLQGGSPGCWAEFITPQQWPHSSYRWCILCISRDPLVFLFCRREVHGGFSSYCWCIWCIWYFCISQILSSDSGNCLSLILSRMTNPKTDPMTNPMMKTETMTTMTIMANNCDVRAFSQSIYHVGYQVIQISSVTIPRMCVIFAFVLLSVMWSGLTPTGIGYQVIQVSALQKIARTLGPSRECAPDSHPDILFLLRPGIHWYGIGCWAP